MWKATAEIVVFFVITILMMLLMVICPFAFMRFGKSHNKSSENLKPVPVSAAAPVARKPRIRILATAGLANCAIRLGDRLPRNTQVAEVNLAGNI